MNLPLKFSFAFKKYVVGAHQNHIFDSHFNVSFPCFALCSTVQHCFICLSNDRKESGFQSTIIACPLISPKAGITEKARPVPLIEIGDEGYQENIHVYTHTYSDIFMRVLAT